MNMRKILPMMMMVVTPVVGMAQNRSGLNEKDLDRSVRPQDDFYEFADGGWQKLNPLPPSRSRFGTFDQLQDNNNKRINTILTGLEKKHYSKGTIEQKLADFYKLALDVNRRNQEGLAPVEPVLKEIEAAGTIEDLRRLQLKYASRGLGMQFDDDFDADQKNAAMNILNIGQDGLTLGEKDYYINNDSATVAIRNAYRQFIDKMFRLYGFNAEEAAQRRDAVFRQETLVALISRSMTDLRDPESNYHKMTLKQFDADYPDIPLKEITGAEGIRPEY
ncbi:MAG: M13 family metallopeptidase, partial [Prevotella sp.]|nr:M13 family metallopeptidase [Prevotella sp.]